MEMCRITLVVLCTKYIHGFILITLLFQEKCPWNIVLEVKEVLEGTQGYSLIQSTAKLILDMSIECQDDFARNKSHQSEPMGRIAPNNHQIHSTHLT